MLDVIRSFFKPADDASNPVADVGRMDIRMAACVLLLEIAHADDEFTNDEAQHLRSALRRQFQFTDDQADELIQLADRKRATAHDVYQFTKLLRDHYSLGQKMVLAEVMWGLVYADGEMCADEEYIMRKVCNLLALEPGYLADVRKRVEGAS